jgi:hypothetical protein
MGDKRDVMVEIMYHSKLSSAGKRKCTRCPFYLTYYAYTSDLITGLLRSEMVLVSPTGDSANKSLMGHI